MEVKLLEDVSEADWHNLLTISNNATLFDSIDFLNYHPAEKFDTHHLLFYNNNELIALMAAAVVEENGGKILKAPYGASTGGPVFKKDISFILINEVIFTIIEYAKQKTLDTIKIKLAPSFYLVEPNDYLTFGLFANGFRLAKRWLTMVTVLPDSFENLIAKTPERKQRYFKQAIKNDLKFSVGNIADLEDFYEILLINRAKFNAQPTHSLSELKYLMENCPDEIKLFFVKNNDKALAAGLVFELTGKIAYTFYLCHLDEGEPLRSSLFCSLKIHEHYINEKFRYLDLGPSTFDDLKLNVGGIKFKEELGCIGFSRDEWVINLSEHE